MLVPVRFADLKNPPKLWLRSNLCKLGYSLLSVLLHTLSISICGELVFIKVKIVLSHLFKLLLRHDKLRVIHLIHVNGLSVDLLLIGPFLNCLPVTHLHLDVLPLCRHSTSHLA